MFGSLLPRPPLRSPLRSRASEELEWLKVEEADVVVPDDDLVEASEAASSSVDVIAKPSSADPPWFRAWKKATEESAAAEAAAAEKTPSALTLTLTPSSTPPLTPASVGVSGGELGGVSVGVSVGNALTPL